MSIKLFLEPDSVQGIKLEKSLASNIRLCVRQFCPLEKETKFHWIYKFSTHTKLYYFQNHQPRDQEDLFQMFFEFRKVQINTKYQISE